MLTLEPSPRFRVFAHCGIVQSLGDEWPLMENTKFPYGVGTHTAEDSLRYIEQNLLEPYLPSGTNLDIMEIGTSPWVRADEALS